jgi:hypothetical protein
MPAGADSILPRCGCLGLRAHWFLHRGVERAFGVDQAAAGEDFLADFLGDVLVVEEELLGILAALAEPRATVGVPGPDFRRR